MTSTDHRIPTPRPRVVWWAAQQDVKAAPKAVLLALAVYANDDGECFPSIATIARTASLSERTCRAAVRCLQQLDLLTCIPRKRALTDMDSSNRYVLHLGITRMAGENFSTVGLDFGEFPGRQLSPPQDLRAARVADEQGTYTRHARGGETPSVKKNRDAYNPKFQGGESCRPGINAIEDDFDPFAEDLRQAKERP